VTDNGTPALSASQAVTIQVREVNLAPALGALPDRTVDPGQILLLRAEATDSDLPGQTLTFSLDAAPAGARIDPATGAIEWRPGSTHAGTVQPFVVRVEDGAAANGGAVQSFQVTIKALAEVRVTAIGFEGAEFLISVTGNSGLTYEVEKASQLGEWTTLTSVTPGAIPFVVRDPGSSLEVRFYRVRVLP
jgi:hypothetical protein